MTKGPNYREPKTINLTKAKIEIFTALDTCIHKIADKTNTIEEPFEAWKTAIVHKVKEQCIV